LIEAAKPNLAVFKFPPVTQAPTAMFAFHSSVEFVAGCPPNAIADVVVPPPPNSGLAKFKSFVSDH